MNTVLAKSLVTVGEGTTALNVGDEGFFTPAAEGETHGRFVSLHNRTYAVRNFEVERVTRLHIEVKALFRGQFAELLANGKIASIVLPEGFEAKFTNLPMTSIILTNGDGAMLSNTRYDILNGLDVVAHSTADATIFIEHAGMGITPTQPDDFVTPAEEFPEYEDFDAADWGAMNSEFGYTEEDFEPSSHEDDDDDFDYHMQMSKFAETEEARNYHAAKAVSALEDFEDGDLDGELWDDDEDLMDEYDRLARSAGFKNEADAQRADYERD